MSDQCKTIEWFGVGGLGDSYFKESSQSFENVSSIEIVTNTLNSYVADRNLPVPQLLKIDTQGSELDIIAGSCSFISSVKYVLMECPLIEYNLGAPNIQKYLTTMSDLGFVPIDVTEIHYMSGKTVQIDIAFINEQVRILT